MQVIVESRVTDASQMRESSVKRVRFSLRRLTPWVPRAKVQFSDVNGPRGGVDKRCQVELSTDTGATVVIALMPPCRKPRSWKWPMVAGSTCRNNSSRSAAHGAGMLPRCMPVISVILKVE